MHDLSARTPPYPLLSNNLICGHPLTRVSSCRDLEAEHSETQLEQNALALLKPIKEEPATATSELAEEVVAALKTYTASLESHLEREERALVATWLNLDSEQYAEYRTYLVGKYRLAY